MNISAFTVRRPVLVCMATLIVMLVGIVSFTRIPVDLMPDTSVPTLSVTAGYPGAGPAEVEKLVTRPLEDALSSIEGLRHIQSTSNAGYCRVRLVFDWGADLEKVMRDTRELIAKVERRLPEDVETPALRKYDPNDLPVLVYGITSDDDPVGLTRKLEDEVVPLLTRIDGIGDVEVLGGSWLEVQVVTDLKKLKALKLSVSDIANVIKKQNFTVSAGSVETGMRRQDLRISADIDQLSELRHTLVQSYAEGDVFLSDVAMVELTPARVRSVSYVDGVRGLRLAVNKVAGANTVAVAQEVNRAIAQMQKRNPDVKFTEVFNTAIYIESSIKNVNFSALYGGVLAIFVLIVFLRNMRSALVIGISIPVSVIATFALIYFNGLSLNLMTIGGLALGVGMLVDNAIVVLENIMRLRHNGHSLFEASIKGGAEVQSSIIASTITTLIVFLPVIFMKGVTSLLFKELAIVVVFSMLVSLASAVLLIPTLASLLVRGSDDPETHVERGFWGVLARFFDRVEKRYVRILRESLKSRGWTITICLLLLGTAGVLIPKIGSEFMPSADTNEIRITATHARGTSQEVILESMLSIVNTLKADFPEVLHSMGYIRDDSENNRANINLLLVAPSERKETARALNYRIMERFSTMPGVSIRGYVPNSPFMPKLPNTTGNLAEIEIRGYNLDQFEPFALQLKASLEEIADVEEIQIPEYRKRSEKLVKIQKIKTAELGISLQTLSTEIKTYLSGLTAGNYLQDGIEYPIRLTVAGYRDVSPEDILTLTVNNKSDEPIMFNNLLHIEDYEGPARIDRDNRQRIMSLGVTLADTGRESFVLEEMEDALNTMPMPAGFSVALGGTYQQQKKSNRDLMISLVLVVLLIYMVMAAQFESLLHPFVIMFSVPLAAIGVLWMLYLTDTTFNMQSNMGCVMLAGIVVNNAILLVDQTNMLREQKMPMMEALLEAGRRRLRPILMTTATTVLGLLPLAIGMGDGGEAQAPMARAVMGGLLSSTFITLVLVPVLYSLFENRKKKQC